MNPVAILVAVILAISLWFGGDHVGHGRGINEQKVADQALFDKLNNDIADQKTQANAAYRAFQEHNVALMVERDQLKTTLEKEYEANRAATAVLRDKYASLGLRFAAIKDSGSGDSGRGAQSTGANSADTASAAVVQLPDSIAADLRRLVFDSDELADNYRKCYGYAQKVK